MKELYKEFFYVPEDGKVAEKVMLARVTVAVVLIVACLISMSMSAYAFFAHNVTSVDNVVKVGNFQSDVTVTYKNGEGQTVALTVSDGEKNSKITFLMPDITYTVTVKASEDTTASTGFCIVKIDGNENVYHTQQIGVDGEDTRDAVEFDLTVSEAAPLRITACWGTSSYYDAYKSTLENHELYIVSGDVLSVTVNSTGTQQGGQSTITEPEETTGPAETTARPEETTAQTQKPEETTESPQTQKPEETTAPEETTEKPADTTENETTAVETEETVNEETTVAVTEPAEEETTAPAES